MGVRLHFQSTGIVLGQGAPVPMIGPALTIGRGAQNDLCLPDPGKVISKNHCAIERHGGRLVVVDLSTNGTYLNYAREPVGPVPAPLDDGDILTIGGYELRVEVTPAPEPVRPADPPVPVEAAPDPLLDDLVPPGPGDGSDFLDDLLGGDTAPAGPAGVTRPGPGDDGLLPPLGEEDGLLDPLPEPGGGADPAGAAGLTGHSDAGHDAFVPQAPQAQPIPDDWEAELGLPATAAGGGAPGGGVSPRLGVAPPPHPPGETPGGAGQVPPGSPPGPKTVPPAEAAPVPQAGGDPTSDGPDAAPAAAPAAAPTPAAPADPAARAFLAALGAADVGVSDAELEEVMTRLGEVMAVMVAGMREILMTRASIKSEFRIRQTTIGAGDNNPLKFSVSPEQAIAALVRPESGYLPAREAAEQALDDIKAHEVAMMTAMDAALKGVLRKLSPAELEAQLNSGGGLSGLLRGRKARYWEVYESMYARISDQAENDFHDLFGRAFARAYQAQTERLK